MTQVYDPRTTDIGETVEKLRELLDLSVSGGDGDTCDLVRQSRRDAAVVALQNAFNVHNPAAGFLPTLLTALEGNLQGNLAGSDARGDGTNTPPPKDGTPFYSLRRVPMRWLAYKPSSQQAKHGIAGRWQEGNGFGGWQSTEWKADAFPWQPLPSTTLPMKES